MPNRRPKSALATSVAPAIVTPTANTLAGSVTCQANINMDSKPTAINPKILRQALTTYLLLALAPDDDGIRGGTGTLLPSAFEPAITRPPMSPVEKALPALKRIQMKNAITSRDFSPRGPSSG